MRYWLVKTEPEEYSFADLIKAGTGCWDGVRNFSARRHLTEMTRGDAVLVYHSGKEKAVVGVASVARTAYPDPTAQEGSWVAVDLRAVKVLKKPVRLADMKHFPEALEQPFLRQGRLSVSPLSAHFAQQILVLGRK